MCGQSNHRPSRRRVLATLPAAALLSGFGLGAARADAPGIDLPAPGPRDTCPVCGMFVARYPEWVATILWDDGEAVHFDGAKDFFKYLQDLEKYAPGRSPAGIAGMGVTEYYGLTLIDAGQAVYVIGSDVLGPMGHELVPLANAADVAEFFEDHDGKRQVTFSEVTPPLLADLDRGRFK
ncbi:nitrous oxide reductase accessory protein NosL [Tropicimonas sp. IMCC6043]|uniref:nitrous oxide reductase accessory protein NosL n=1 Tax=Tropicimonas sp. IMCC6043 TaxID=2510645 RepID=UPI00101D64DD|nr:nitrous oxide reductase accessory protein NosL [Tropicimonas sp. IMCC6043]RYH10821.1 nitrous oxide reductase accessory protein NosL [Tropicimonas sp. IMCC6043]